MNHVIEVTDSVPGTVFELHRMIRPDRIGADIGAGLTDLYEEAAIAGVRPAGPPGVTYLDPPVEGEQMHVAIGVPVTPPTGHGAAPDARLVGRHSRAVARTVHHGDYAGIAAAYRELTDWIFSHGYRTAGPPTETYLVGPGGAADPAGYRTEICFPVIPSPGLAIRVERAVPGTLERARKALLEAGFGPLTTIDLGARAGAAAEHHVLLGVWPVDLARRALGSDPEAGLLLPCTVAVRAEGDGTVVEALDPGLQVRAGGLTELEAVAAEARERLAAALGSLRPAGRWTR